MALVHEKESAPRGLNFGERGNFKFNVVNKNWNCSGSQFKVGTHLSVKSVRFRSVLSVSQTLLLCTYCTIHSTGLQGLQRVTAGTFTIVKR